MSGKWVPPHLRGKASKSSFKTTGVRFPSNTTGNNSRNVSYKNAPTEFNNAENARPSARYEKVSRRLATRKLRAKPLKSALKKGKTHRHRRHTA